MHCYIVPLFPCPCLHKKLYKHKTEVNFGMLISESYTFLALKRYMESRITITEYLVFNKQWSALIFLCTYHLTSNIVQWMSCLLESSSRSTWTSNNFNAEIWNIGTWQIHTDDWCTSIIRWMSMQRETDIATIDFHWTLKFCI